MSKTTQQIINSTELVSLSSEYRYDTENKKIDFKPVRYDYSEGYSFFHHDPLKGAKDEAFSNGNYFALINDVIADDMRHGISVDPLELVVWVTLMGPNKKYLRTTGKRVYADTEIWDINQKCVFKIIKKYTRDGDGNRYKSYFNIMQDEKYFTVDVTHNRFDITLEDKIFGDENGKRLQCFGIERTNDPSKILFYTMMDGQQVWGKDMTQQGKPYWEDTEYVQRFFALYESNNRTTPPPTFYTGENNQKIDMLKTIGAEYYKGYDFSGCEYSNESLRMSNNYIFTIGRDSESIKDGSLVLGYDGKVKWVKYHNDFYDSYFNMDTTPAEVIDTIKPSVLFEVPYENGIGESNEDGFKIHNINGEWYKIKKQETAGLKVSPIELKSVMTPNYRYTKIEKNTGNTEE